jgi:hypothetical protein
VDNRYPSDSINTISSTISVGYLLDHYPYHIHIRWISINTYYILKSWYRCLFGAKIILPFIFYLFLGISLWTSPIHLYPTWILDFGGFQLSTQPKLGCRTICRVLVSRARNTQIHLKTGLPNKALGMWWPGESVSHAKLQASSMQKGSRRSRFLSCGCAVTPYEIAWPPTRTMARLHSAASKYTLLFSWSNAVQSLPTAVWHNADAGPRTLRAVIVLAF